MKFKIVTLSIIASCFLLACNKNKPGTVNCKFTVESNGTPVNLFTQHIYTLANGTKFNATLLKFYVSNIRLIKENGEAVSANNYTLISPHDNKDTYTFNSIPGAKYKSIVFNLGVDSQRNHTGAQTGDLDPSIGMIWTWNTGYIFFKHEGEFINNAGVTDYLVYHYGSDKAHVSDITLPIPNNLKIAGNTCTATIALDLNKLYTNLDFNVDKNRQSMDQASIPWIKTIKTNAYNAFSLKGIQ